MSESIKILDGGLGRQLKLRLSSSFDPLLWSASAFVEDPDIVYDVHQEFIQAGAQVITTNNYSVVPAILEPAQYIHKFQEFTQLAGRLAKAAQQDASNTVQVAGCLPPLKSTYRPDLIDNSNKAIAIYSQIIEWLYDDIDVFLCESMSSIIEAKLVLKALKGVNKPVWLSFIVDDLNPTVLLSGESVELLGQEFSEFSVQAMMFNCAQPVSITQALSSLSYSGLKGGYANAFKTLDTQWNHLDGKLRPTDTSLNTNNYLEYVREWINLGASIVGGCCGIGPDYIRAIAKEFG